MGLPLPIAKPILYIYIHTSIQRIRVLGCPWSVSVPKYLTSVFGCFVEAPVITSDKPDSGQQGSLQRISEVVNRGTHTLTKTKASSAEVMKEDVPFVMTVKQTA